jgi:antitoxin component YwqK of YwqJK toxin-antitoxin module
MIRTFFFLQFVSIILSCGPKKQTVNYPSGAVKEEIEMDTKGRRHGSYKQYYENGKLREQALYRHDTLVGERTLYYENGNPEVKEPYDQHGLLNGTYRQFYPEGGVQLELVYIDNVISGMSKAYFPSGQLKEEVTMMQNEENGPFTEYFRNGKIAWKGTYKDGDDEIGWLEEYDSLGQLIKVMRCDTPGICRTKWKPGMPPLAR